MKVDLNNNNNLKIVDYFIPLLLSDKKVEIIKLDNHIVINWTNYKNVKSRASKMQEKVKSNKAIACLEQIETLLGKELGKIPLKKESLDMWNFLYNKTDNEDEISIVWKNETKRYSVNKKENKITFVPKNIKESENNLNQNKESEDKKIEDKKTEKEKEDDLEKNKKQVSENVDLEKKEKKLPFKVEEIKEEEEIRVLFQNLWGQITRNKKLDESQIKIWEAIIDKEKRPQFLMPIMLLALQNEKGITDLHMRILWAKRAHIQGRINQVLQPITITDLKELYLSYQSKFDNFFWQKTIKRLFNLLRTLVEWEDLIFDLSDDWQGAFYFFLYSNFIRLTRSFNEVKKRNIEENIRLYFFPKNKEDKLEFRMQFTHTEAEWKEHYKLVTRLLATEIIRPDYKDFMDMILSNLWKKGLNLILWPTNSGKSSSITRKLKKLHEKKPNWCYDSIEKPVEKTLDFVNHCQVYNGPNEFLDYQDHLDAQVRSDWDVVFLGEIRNSKDLQAAIQLSRIWYTLFSTLHGNSILSYKWRIRTWWNVRDALVIVNNLITQQLFPYYKNVIKIKDLNKNNSSHNKLIKESALIKDIKKKLEWEESWPILKSFYKKTKKYSVTVKNNIIIPQKKKRPLLDNLKNIDKFAEYLAHNFNVPLDKYPSSMRLLFEFLEVDDEFVKASLEDKEVDNYILTEKNDVFVPHFVNSMVYYSNSNINISAIENLAWAYY